MPDAPGSLRGSHPLRRRARPEAGRTLPAALDPARHSLVRASLLVLGAMLFAVVLSDFPRNRATPWLILPLLLATTGTADTVRCMQKRWSFYHAGVILCVYMDLMCVAAILFLLVYPYIAPF